MLQCRKLHDSIHDSPSMLGRLKTKINVGEPFMAKKFAELATSIWQVGDLPFAYYKQPEYGVIRGR